MDIKLILELHLKWLRNEVGGSRANLSEANLSGANLSRANLIRANLSRANLSDANLSEANLSEANLSRANLIFIQERYSIYIQVNHTRIGCEYHKNTEWRNFTDKEIFDMDKDALYFWNRMKGIIFAGMDLLENSK